MPDPQITIPGLEKFSAPVCEAGVCHVNWVGKYIEAVYRYAIGVVGILATVVMMIGGIMWIVAGGNATRIGEAKSWITAALTGLILALTSYIILYQVNPNLTAFKAISVKTVDPIETKITASEIFSVCQDKFGTVISVSGTNDSMAYADCSRQCSPNPVSNNSFLFNNNHNYCCLCEESPGAIGYCMSQGFCIPVSVSLDDCRLSGGEFYCSDVNCTTNCIAVNEPSSSTNSETGTEQLYDCDSRFWIETSGGTIITNFDTLANTNEAGCRDFHDNRRLIIEQIIAEETNFTRITDERITLVEVSIIN